MFYFNHSACRRSEYEQHKPQIWSRKSMNCVNTKQRGVKLLLSVVLSVVGMFASNAKAQISFVSSSSNGGDNVSPLVVSAPAGIQVDDLLLAYVSTREDGGNIGAPAGWTEIFEVANGNAVDLAAFYKVADAADASAGSFSNLVERR